MFPMMALSQVAQPIQRSIEVLPGTNYRTIGVRLWGEGAYERATIDGTQTAAKTLTLVKENDLIINKIWVRNGSTAIASRKVDGCAASGEFPTFELDQAKILPRWLHWITKTKDFWHKCDVLSQGTSGKNRIKPELFLTITIPLPPLEEQRRIVARIEELAAKIEEARGLRREAVEEVEELWISSLEATFNMLAGKHSNKLFRDFCDVVRGGSPRPAGDPTYYDGTIPFLKVADLTNHSGKFVTTYSATIKEVGLSRSRYVNAGTLLLTNSGATLGVPKICTFGTCFNDGIQAFLNVPEDISIEYIYYFFLLKTRWFREWVARGQGQPNLNTDMVKTMSIPVPTLTEQKSIVAHLDKTHNQVVNLKQQQSTTITQLNALLPSILDKAFKGEL